MLFSCGRIVARVPVLSYFQAAHVPLCAVASVFVSPSLPLSQPNSRLPCRDLVAHWELSKWGNDRIFLPRRERIPRTGGVWRYPRKAKEKRGEKFISAARFQCQHNKSDRPPNAYKKNKRMSATWWFSIIAWSNSKWNGTRRARSTFRGIYI